MTWDWNYAVQVLPKLLAGLKVTVQITVLGSFLALGIGLLLALMRYLRIPVIARAAHWYIQFFRNTPLLVQLYLFFFVLPQIGVSFSPVTSGIIVLGMHTGGYMAEVYRAGIEAVPREQWDACTALNLPIVKIWRRIVLPQALPPIIPALGNYVNEMFKLTAYVATIGAIELFGQGLRVSELTYQYVVPFTLVGVLYLAVSTTLTVLLRRLEMRNARRRTSWAQG